MKIVLAQLNFHVGNFSYNLGKIVDSIRKAIMEKADLIVFSELSLTGYPPRDFLNYPGFIEKCRTSIEEILPLSLDIDIILGLPWENPNRPGKALYNAALHISGNKIKQVVAKALLPTYDIFDEYRYFEPGSEFHCLEIKGHTVALTICEDLWNIENGQYRFSPMDVLIQEEPEIMINIAASPFFYRQKEARIQVLKANTHRYNIPLVYVNHVGAQTDLLFDGGSLALDAENNFLVEASYFEEDFRILDFALKEKSLVKRAPHLRGADQGSQVPGAKLDKDIKHISLEIFHNKELLKRIHEALLMGIRDFFRKSGFKKAVIGLSGGIDSALVMVLATQALGPENVFGVLMPSRYSSEHSLEDAYELMKRLGTKGIEIPIESITQSAQAELKPLFGDLPFGLAEENIQSRTRGLLLMAISNKLGYILLNTSNKSEAAVGYGTLYGDMCGAISVIGDLYKTQVFALCRYLNLDKEIIPLNILVKAPSAELRPDQKDSDSLPDYAELDSVLFGYIEENRDFDDLIQDGFSRELIHRTLNLVNKAEFKRYQFCPILRVSSKAFGMGRRMPLVGKYDQ